MNVFQRYGALIAAMEEHGDPICRTSDPDMWFPETGEGNSHSIKIAKAFCAECPLLNECRNYAIAAKEPHGIWGGMDAMQRNNLRRTEKRHARERLAS